MEKRLALVIDPSGAKKGYADAKKMTTDLEKSAKGVTSAFERMSKSLSNIAKGFSGLERTLSSAGLDRFEKTVKDSIGSMNALAAALGKLDTASRGLIRSQDSVTDSTRKTTTAQESFQAETSASERAARSFANSLAFWEKRSEDLKGTEYERLVQLRESARQVEAYKKSMVDALTPVQKMQKEENELQKQLESTQRKLKTYESGLAQKNIEAQEAAALSKKLAQSEERLKNSFTDQYRKIVENNEALKKRTRELRNLEEASQHTARGTRSLSAEMVTLGSAITGFSLGMFLQDVARTSDAYKGLQNRIAVVTGTTEGLTEVTRDLLSVAQESRSELDATADVYAKLSRVNNQYGLSQQELLKITTTVSQAVSMSGATAQGAQGAMIQFAQALQNNFAAAAQEMNSIIEQTPGLADAIADAMNAVEGVTTYHMGNIKKAATEGTLEVQKVLEGLLLVSEDYTERFQLSQVLLSQGWVQVKNALTVYIGELDAASGLSEEIAQWMMDLSGNFDEFEGAVAGAAAALGTLLALTTAAGFAAIGSLLGVGGTVVAGLTLIAGLSTQWAVENDKINITVEDIKESYAGIMEVLDNDILQATVTGLATAAAGYYALTTAATAYTGAAGLATKATAALNAMIRANPLVFMASVLAGATAALYQYLDGTSELDKVIRRNAASVEELQDAYEGLTKVQLENELARLTVELGKVKISQQEAAKAIVETSNKTASSAGLLGGMAGELAKVSQKSVETSGTQVALESAIAGVQEALDRLGDSADKAGESTSDFGTGSSGASDELKTFNELMRDTIKGLEEEIYLIGLSEKEVALYQMRTELMNAAKEAGVRVTQEQIQEITRLNDILFASREAHEASEEAAKAQQDALEDLRDNIADTFMDGFEAAMEGGEEFSDWFEDLLKELAMTAIRNKIVIPIVGDMLGIEGSTGGVVGQASGATSGSGFSLSNIGSMFSGNGVGSMISDFGGWVGGSSPLAGTGVGNYISGATANAANLTNLQVGLGGIGGSLLSDALGLSGEYSGITGSIGTALGTALLTPMLGPFAPLVGSFLGSALGGLGNQEPSNFEGRAMMDITSGAMEVVGQSGEKFSQENRDAAANLASIIQNNIIGSIERLSGDEIEGRFIAGMGGRDPFRFHYDPDEDLTYTSAGFAEWEYGMGRDTSQGHDYESTILDYLTEKGVDTTGMSTKTRDTEKYLNTITAFFATMQGIDIAPYQALADESEALIDTLNRVELQVGLVSAVFDSVGRSTEEVTKEFADSWTDEFIKPLQKSGEKLPETLARVAAQLQTVSSYTDLFGQSLGTTAEGVLKASNTIIKAAGGLEQFNASASSYYQNFYSEEERFKIFAEDLEATFNSLNLELPTTIKGFRSLVESLDLTKESDQELYAQLLQLNPQVKQFIDGLSTMGSSLNNLAAILAGFRENADKALASVMDAIDNQRDAVTDRYNSEKDRLQDLLEGEQEAYNARMDAIDDQLAALQDVKALGKTLRGLFNSLNMSTPSFMRSVRSEAQGFISSSLNTFRSTGGLPSTDALAPYLETLRQPSEDLFSSFEEYAYDFFTTKNDIGDLATAAEETFSLEEQALMLQKDQARDSLEYYEDHLKQLDKWYSDEMSSLDAQAEEAERMYSTVFGIGEAVSEGFPSVVAALNNLRSALADAVKLQQNSGGTFGKLPDGSPSITYEDDPLTKAYQEVLGRDPDVEGYKHWAEKLASGAVSEENLAEAIAEVAANFDIGSYTGPVSDDLLQQSIDNAKDYLESSNIRGFANGGIHSGGWRMVGETGPELEYTPPSRIYSSADSAALVDMSEVIEAIRELKEESRQANVAIARNTMKVAKVLDRWDYDGQPEVRDYSA